MKKLIGLYSIIGVLVLFSIAGVAQTTDAAEEDSPQWRITEKEVVAVQTELRRRGYYNLKPSGVLDRSTREAVKTYQSENGLQVTGRIDRPTYEKLELPYPATGKERDSERRGGLLPSIGYGIKDTATATGSAVGGAANKVKGGTKGGYDKTRDTGNGALTKTKETVQGVGDATKKGAKTGAKTVSRGTQRASDALVGRSDDDIQTDVREVLNSDSKTEKWFSEVKNGLVTIKTPPEHGADVGVVVSGIRKIPGVKSVFVIAE